MNTISGLNKNHFIHRQNKQMILMWLLTLLCFHQTSNIRS